MIKLLLRSNRICVGFEISLKKCGQSNQFKIVINLSRQEFQNDGVIPSIYFHFVKHSGQIILRWNHLFQQNAGQD